MRTPQVVIILAFLGTPAICAPLLARFRSRFSRGLWLSVASIVCAAPLAAPWIVAGSASPLATWLVVIIGGITMIRAIGWLACPRQELGLVRTLLVLTVWPALEIEDVGVRL